MTDNQTSDAKTSTTKPKHVKTTTPNPSNENEGNTVKTCEVCTRFVRNGRCSHCGHTPEPTSAPVPSEQDDSADLATTPADGDSAPQEKAGAPSEG